ncbi:hypothetical protein LCGC14_2021250 [marine sediment metagenome]|uniref:Uncharacterized protein n=1 Tax=marine sediment metagenome TaxID=412755 RepID=A0A0F9EXK4_9ZZZZ
MAEIGELETHWLEDGTLCFLVFAYVTAVEAAVIGVIVEVFCR